jgi:hypothetical protein
MYDYNASKGFDQTFNVQSQSPAIKMSSFAYAAPSDMAKPVGEKVKRGIIYRGR